MNAADEAECKLLSDLVQEHFGLSFAGVRRDILASRVRPRLAALRLGNLLDYYHYLRSHPRRDSELDELVVCLEALVDAGRDSVYAFPMCRTDFARVVLLGRAFDEDLVTDGLRTLLM